MEKETLEETAERLQKDKYGIFISKDADVKGQLVIDTGRAAFLSGMREGVEWQEEKMFKLCEEWQEYVRINYHPEFSSISFRAYVESKKE